MSVQIWTGDAMHRITLLALNECFASNVIGAADLLHAANLTAARLEPPRGPLFEWRVVSPSGKPVRASNGATLSVDGAPDQVAVGKLIIVPAFGSPEPQHFLSVLDDNRCLLPWLRAQYAAGATLAAVCSGNFLLAESGLLDARCATTSWWLAPLFRQRYPKIHLDIRSMLTESGRLICAGTGMSHIDLVLHLIGRLAGRDVARLCAKFVALDDRRRSQASYLVRSFARARDPLIDRAERWIEGNLRGDITLERLASHLAVSARTLGRHFKQSTGDSPLGFVQKVRIETSKALLENTNLRISEIVFRVGYQDESSFRRQFKKETSVSPTDYRKRFGLSVGLAPAFSTAEQSAPWPA
jgi:transcriptional regulator GlxA family with amidase domain